MNALLVERRSDPRRGTAARVGLALAATGVASAALARRSLAGTHADIPTAIAFAAFVALLLLAGLRRPPAASAWLALGAAALVYLLAALELHDAPAAVALYLLAAALAAWRTAPHLRPFAAAAFALWIPALWLSAPRAAEAGPAWTLPPALLVAAALALLYTVAVLVDPSRVHPSDRLRRVGCGFLAIATVDTVVARHLLVGSAGLAPDDVAAVAAAVLLPLLAHVRLRSTTRDALVAAVALGTFALAGVALLSGVPYHADSVAAPHRAAELLLEGRDPYAAFDLPEAVVRFGMEARMATHLESGAQVHTYNYPALSFLVLVPFVAAGLGDVRWLYLAEIVLIALVAAGALRRAWRPMALATVVGSGLVATQFVVAGVDPTWALLVLGAYLARSRRWLSPLLLGLALASRQTAWFVVPFYVVAVALDDGPREAARRAAVAALVAVAVHLPFLFGAPDRLVGGLLVPMLAPLEPDGLGFIRFGLGGAMPLLPRAAYAALALGAFLALLALVWRRPRAVASAPLVWPFLPLYLAWRSQLNYFAFAPLFAFAGDDELAEAADQSSSTATG